MFVMKKINWDFIWGYYLPVSTFSEKSKLLFLRWGWKNVGGTHIWEKSQIWEKTWRWVWFWENINLVAQFLRKTQILALEPPNRIFSRVWGKICLVAQFGDKKANFLRNIRFEKIFDLVAPRQKFEFFSKNVPPN